MSSLLSLAIWTPIVFGAVLLALGRDEQARAVRWIALIGYVDAAYVDQSIKALSYNGVKYSIDNVVNGTYPVYTFGRMYTKGEPTAGVKAFIDYVTGKEFQDAYAEKNGFVPITKLKK